MDAGAAQTEPGGRVSSRRLTVSCPQVAYEDWFITLYNLCYSSLPVLLVGLLDQVSGLCVPAALDTCSSSPSSSSPSRT